MIRMIEPDARVRSALAATRILDADISFLTADELLSTAAQLANADAVVIAVDQPRDLELVAGVCARGGLPPVIAVSGQGHGGRSLEDVLLLAELRGAVATLVKPFTAEELAAVALEVCNRRRAA